MACIHSLQPHGGSMCCVKASQCAAPANAVARCGPESCSSKSPTWPLGRIRFLTKQQKHTRAAVMDTRDTVKITECDTLPSRQLAAATQPPLQAVSWCTQAWAQRCQMLCQQSELNTDSCQYWRVNVVDLCLKVEICSILYLYVYIVFFFAKRLLFYFIGWYCCSPF